MFRKSKIGTSDLPERLRYLQPFRKKFATRSPEDLHEDSGTRPLMALLSKHIQGLSLEDAIATLQQDHATLEQWLSARSYDPLHFALGFFLTGTPADLAKLLKEEPEQARKPRLRLRIELPVGAKPVRAAGAGEDGVLVSYRGLHFCVEALPDEAQELPESALGAGGIDVAASNVRFGDATGKKFVQTGESWRGPFKKIRYQLQVPGGRVLASISSASKKTDHPSWDEAPVEACFHTLRVEVQGSLRTEL